MEEYLDKLDIIDKVEHESVETRNKFFNVAKLTYDNIDETGIPVLEYISKMTDDSKVTG